MPIFSGYICKNLQGPKKIYTDTVRASVTNMRYDFGEIGNFSYFKLGGALWFIVRAIPSGVWPP